MATPKQQQDGRYFMNAGYIEPGSRSQAKFMLGRISEDAIIRAAMIEKLWQFCVELATEFGEPEIWDPLGLHIAKRVASGEKNIDVKTDADDAPELAVGLLTGWQDCIPGIKLRLRDQRVEHEGREYRRSQAELLRNVASALIAGGGGQRLHEAISAYVEAIKNHKPYLIANNGSVSQWADAKQRQIEFCRQHLVDVRLTDLDMERIEECLSIIAARPFKRTPSGKPTTTPISKSFASSVIKEFRKFLRWLHRSRDWEWEKPKDYEVIPIRVRGDGANAGPIRVQTYEPHELKTMWMYATPWERALMALGLNTGFGMAEIGTLRKDEIFLFQVHPHAAKLAIESTDQDSWIMRVRVKTGVYSEWRLWQVTVKAIQWLIDHRPQSASEFVVLTKKGTPLTTEGERNNQIAHAWKRLFERIRKDNAGFRQLSYNKIRKTGSNWIRMIHGKEIADLYLSHGEPVGEDVVAAYTNPRFAALHGAVTDLGVALESVFGSVTDPFPKQEKKGGANISLGTIQQIIELAKAGNRPAIIAERLNLSRETVRRWIKRQQPGQSHMQPDEKKPILDGA